MLMPQSLNGAGIEKSLRVAVSDCDERVSAKNVEIQGTLPKVAWRSIPPSMNSPCPYVELPFLSRKPAIAGTPAAPLTIAYLVLTPLGSHFSAFDADATVRLPVAPPTHLSTSISGAAPPVRKSATIKKSPSWWWPLNPPEAPPEALLLIPTVESPT